MKRLSFALIMLAFCCTVTVAQEFEIKKYDVNAKVNVETRSLEMTAKLRLVNLSPPDLADKILLSTDNKPRMSFYLNEKAKLGTLTVNGAAVTPKTTEDTRNRLLRVSTEMTATLAAAREFDVEFVYTLPSPERNSSLHVSANESFALPPGFWVPVVHTPYAEHSADTGPLTLTVTVPGNLKVVSNGIRKSDTVFEQPLAAQPFFVAGDYEMTARGGDSLPVEVYAPRGLNAAGKAQAQRLAAEAEKMLAFYARFFGVPANGPFRIISTEARQLGSTSTEELSQARDSAFSTVGAVLLDDSVFRRDALDLGTIEFLAQAAARSWIDGQVLLRGRGAGLLRDALPIYLTAQYLGERFGAAQRESAYDRYRRAYITVARSDAPLLTQSVLDRSYTTVVYNKGALVWRTLELLLGRSSFENLLRAALNRQRVDILSLAGFFDTQTTRRPPHPLCNLSRCADVRMLLLNAGANKQVVSDFFTNWIENAVLPDFVVGQPQPTAAGVESTIANFGNGDFTIEIVATTDKNETLRQQVALKAGEYSTVTFPTGTVIKTIEADPNKLYVQKDYTNDVFPRRANAAEAFGLANTAFGKNDFATAEAKAREALVNEPNQPTLQAFLGRVLLAQNKGAEAKQVFEAILKSDTLPIQAYTYAHFGLGDLALQQSNFTEAAAQYRAAAAAELDPGTTLSAREGALKAERGGNAVKLPEEVRAFLKNLDSVVVSGTSDQVGALLDLGNLKGFSQRLVLRKPTVWTTEALRSEEWDANRLAVDVLLKIRIEGKDYAGRAVYVLNRASGKLLLSEVPIFDVKVTGGTQ
ncbi:MAG: tetratricopeptide repeat protein [Acidobacteria bacterium]|nr:tetratricopeptide repeat protein [Acidobacteriota bacterium]MBI3424510.1 tetratricopeptide repeat protein [Acidobacteriota bacterium]